MRGCPEKKTDSVHILAVGKTGPEISPFFGGGGLLNVSNCNSSQNIYIFSFVFILQQVGVDKGEIPDLAKVSTM